MTSRPAASHDPSAAEDAAALWAAKLDGSTLSSADRRALDAWLEAHPSHRTLLASYCQLSTDLEQQVPLLAGIKDLPVEESSAPVTARPSPWSSRPLWVGAMLTAAAAVALAFWPNPLPPSAAQTLTAPAARRAALTLADGTRVELNARTQLDIVIDRTERRARLSSGQAFFAVAPDAQRPFTVETPAGHVQVTGTQFNIRADEPDRFEVIVVEGSVNVRPRDAGANDRPITLVAGTRYASGTVSTLEAGRMDDLLAWRTGQVVFNDVPLGEALAYVARHHDCRLTASAAAATERLGGRFNVDDLDGFLALLAEALDVVVTKQPDGGFSVSKRGEN